MLKFDFTNFVDCIDFQLLYFVLSYFSPGTLSYLLYLSKMLYAMLSIGVKVKVKVSPPLFYVPLS